jgi:hypothetical protein
MKRLLVLSVFMMSGLASAQSVNWSAAWSGCSAETRTFDAVAQGTSTNSQGVKGWVENHTGSPSTNIEGLRLKLEEDQELLRSHKDPVIRASAQLAICGSTAALRQLQRSSASSSQPQSSQRSGKNASQCVDLDSSDPVVRNNCGAQVYLLWCSVRSASTSTSSSYSCDSGSFGVGEMAAGGRSYVDQGLRNHWFACIAPARPSDVRYVSGEGLQGYCR